MQNDRVKGRARRAASGAALGVAVLAVGCGGETELGRAVQDAAIRVQALNSNGGPAWSVEHAAGVYRDVVSRLKPLADSGREGEQAGAWVLIGQSQLFLAEIPARRALETERAALNLITLIRGSLGQWERQHAQAVALDAYDPTAELAEIDAEARARDEEAAQQRAQRAAVAGEAEGLRAQAKERVDKARSAREQDAALRQRASAMSATEGLPLIEEARTLRRSADALDAEASILDARAQQVERGLGEIDLAIERLETQRQLLAGARAQIQASVATKKEHAAALRAGADASAAEIAARMDELAALRTGTLAPAYEEAARGLSEAAASATKAVKASKLNAQALAGAARRSLGDVQWHRAHSLGIYADVCGALARAEPALPQRDAYAAAAEQARAQRAEALAAATEAYQAAKTAFDGIGASGEAEDIKQKLDALLVGAIFATSGGQVDLRPGLQPEGDAEDSAPADDAGGVSGGADAAAAVPSPNEAIATYERLNAEGRGAEAAAMLILDPPELADQVATLIAQVGPRSQRLKDAITAKFGPEAMAELEDALGVPPADQLDFTVSGDTATAPATASPTGRIVLRLVDGAWKIDAASMGLTAEIIGAQAMAAPMIGAALDQLINAIESGAMTLDDLKAAMAQMGGG